MKIYDVYRPPKTNPIQTQSNPILESRMDDIPHQTRPELIYTEPCRSSRRVGFLYRTFGAGQTFCWEYHTEKIMLFNSVNGKCQIKV